MGSMNIIEFLEARIAEDEQQATKHLKDASARGWASYPVRILAECAAKRALIDTQYAYLATIDGEWGCAHDEDQIRAGECEYYRDFNPGTWPIVTALAAVYNDHRDYRPEWAA
jgi:hypothetical protein